MGDFPSIIKLDKKRKHRQQSSENQRFYDDTKKCQLQNLKNILQNTIMDKKSHIPIPINNIDGKVAHI